MAKEKLVIGESSVTASQMQEIFRQVKDGSITGGMVQSLLERKNPFEETDMNQKSFADWSKFYTKHFNIKVDFSGIKIPELPKEEKWRLLFIAEGLTNNKVFDACKKKFPCYKYADDLDKSVTKNDRDPKNGTYAIWVRDVVEADEVHKNKSAKMLQEGKIFGITLLERMILELKYFTETGKHLDINNWTLCSGSRNFDLYVPYAYWYSDKFKVSWNSTGNSNEFLRSREVVS